MWVLILIVLLYGFEKSWSKSCTKKFRIIDRCSICGLHKTLSSPSYHHHLLTNCNIKSVNCIVPSNFDKLAWHDSLQVLLRQAAISATAKHLVSPTPLDPGRYKPAKKALIPGGLKKPKKQAVMNNSYPKISSYFSSTPSTSAASTPTPPVHILTPSTGKRSKYIQSPTYEDEGVSLSE